MKKLFFIPLTTLSLLTGVSSCMDIPAIRDLTKAEAEFVKQSTDALECEVTVDKDYNVIVKKLSRGHLYINLDFTHAKRNVCMEDSSTIASIAIPMAEGFEKVMDKRNQYDSLTLAVFSMNDSTQGLELETCSQSFTFYLNDLTKYTYKASK